MKPGKKIGRPASSTYHAVTHVWGRQYLDLFLNVCIPNQLAPGNVPALPPGSRYRVLTHSKHVDELEQHPAMHALREVIPVDIVHVEKLEREIDSAPGYELMIACHRKAIADILEADAAMLVLSADFVFSHNALAAAVQRHRDGYRAVANTGLRLVRESFLDALTQAGAPLHALSSRDLVRLALPHLHPYTRAMFVDARPFKPRPEAVYWPVGAEGLVARCLPLHPLLIDPMSPVLLENTIDGRYLSRACPDFSKVHVVTDSDELQMFELTSSAWRFEDGRSVGTPAWRAALVASTCDALQVHYWQKYAIRLHTAELDERWSAATRVADEFAGTVMRLLPYAALAERVRQSSRFLDGVGQRWEHDWKALSRRLPKVRRKRIVRPLQIAKKRVNKTWKTTMRRMFQRVRPQVP